MKCYATCPNCLYRSRGRDTEVYCSFVERPVTRLAQGGLMPEGTTCTVPPARRPILRAQLELTIGVLKDMIAEIDGEAADEAAEAVEDAESVKGAV